MARRRRQSTTALVDNDPCNPVDDVCGIQMKLTTMCHGKGMEASCRAAWTNDQEVQRTAYLDAYYATLRKLMPKHPALAEYERETVETAA